MNQLYSSFSYSKKENPSIKIREIGIITRAYVGILKEYLNIDMTNTLT